MKKRAKKIAIISAAAVLFAAILTVSLIFGIGSCNQSMIITAENTTTVRKTAPTDGTSPEDYSGIDNIAYMAYVLDNQPFYHAYAHNSSRASGYEQVTQTWKDYKSAELSGKNTSIMICSDLSYSTLVKSASQACFVGNGTAYTRTGDKPGRDTVPTGVNWSSSQPTYYDKESYLNVYGEFSTELSVYAINPTTVEDCGETVKNEDGTYSQTFTLKPEAACWYQFGMKTRGGLKGVPLFESIVITFNFDAKWQVLSSYCEERTKIAPGALGGFNMSSSSKTTTTFYYENPDFDNEHYAYFDSYFNKYVGTVIENKPSGDADIEILDVLAGGFGKVLSADGQQFALNLKTGGTEYGGKIYLKLAELSVDAVQARLALEKSGTGKQDFYLEYGNGVANAYFSEAFAITADINKVSSSVKSFVAWIDSFVSGEEAALSVQTEGGGIDLSSLLNSLELTVGTDTVGISLKSDNLLDLGIGVDVELLFDYSKGEDGNSYAFKQLNLNALSFNSTDINISLGVTPDDGGEIISREASDNPADIAEFIDGVLALAKSEVYGVNISLDGSCESIEYINGLVLNAAAKVKPSNNFTAFNANVVLNVSYGGLAVGVTADYAVDFNKGGYGDVYLTLDSINGTEYGAKVKCNIDEIVEAVKQLIAEFSTESGVSAQAEEEQAGLNVADIINTVLNLDFGAILKEIKADGNEISLKVNVDEILSAVGADIGFKLGELNFAIGLNEGKAALKGGLPALGANLSVSGLQGGLPAVNPDEYTDLTAFVSGVHKLLTSEAYYVDIMLDGTCESIKYLNGASTQLTVLVKPDKNFENIVVNVPAFTVNYKGLTVTLGAYYTVNTKEIANGNYGEVYLTVSEIGGQVIDVKAYCNIKDVVSAVTELIQMFAPSSKAVAYGGARAVSGVLDTVLGLDYGAIITEISANADNIKLGVNADALLTAFDVDLGLEIGTVKLALALDGGSATLNGSVESLGLSLSVGGSGESIPSVNAEEYADVTSYINGVKALLSSDTYAVSLKLDGSCESIEYIKGVTASANALVKVNDNFSGFEVYVPALSASYQKLGVVLDIYYTVAFNGGGYGTVYLNVTEIGGQTVDVKVKCNVNEVITAVKEIVEMYSGKTPDEGDGEPVVLSDETAADDKIANVINTVVSIDYKSIINSFTANNTGINASINADELLKALNITVGGLQIGGVSVAVNLASEDKLTLGAKAEELGLTLGLSGSGNDIPELDFTDYADVATYVNGVYNLLNSKTYNVNIGFTGAEFTLKEGSEAINLTGLEVEIPAQVKLSKNFKEITVNAPVTVNYGKELTVKATLYYTVNLDKGYGDIYVTLNCINEDTFNAKVYCNVDNIIVSVKQLIDLFAPSKTALDETVEEAAKISVAEIIAKIVNIDFKAIINELTADNTGVNLSVSADAILFALNVDTKGITLGDVNLTLATDDNRCATLTGSVPKFGISLNLSGNSADMPKFDGNGYLDLNELVTLVTEAVRQSQEIIGQKNVVFALDTELTVDGVKMRVDGNGQVDWNDDKIRVAVQADLTISEGVQSETLKLKLVYDENDVIVTETEGEEQVKLLPLVRFTVNNLGMEIYRKDLEDLSGGFNEILAVVKTIVNTFNTNGGNTADAPENADGSEIQLMSEEGETENKLTAAIGKVFKEIQKVTVSLISAEGTEGKQLVVTYAQNAVLTLGADGGLNLKLGVKNNDATDIININNASIRAAGETDKFAELNAEFARTEEEKPVYEFYAADEEVAFTKAVYDYVFAVLGDLTVKNLLDSDTYTVTVVLDGKNSGIDALKDVYVNAELYYTEISVEGVVKADKLVEMSLGINIGGTAVNANAYYYKDTVYISVNEINGTKLANTFKTQTVDGQEVEVYDGLKISADTQDIYLAADAVVKLITNKNLLPLIQIFAPDGANAEAAAQSEEANAGTEQAVPEAKKNTLTGILNALLSMQVKFGKEDGLNTLVLNADALLEELGLGFNIGTVTVKVNPKSHSVTASAVYGENESWLNVSAEAVKAENTVHGVAPVAEDYIDIGFVQTLLNDVNTTLGSLGTRTEPSDGAEVTKPDVRISLTGNITAQIAYSVVKATIPVNNIKLTAGLDEDDKFFFSLTGGLENRSAELGISLGSIARITQKWDISVTYSNGYITMGRQIGTDGEKFKVMTVEYLLDNLLDKNNSPVRWLLGTSDTVWGLICDNLKLPINSGLTTVKEYYLYDHNVEVPDDTTEEDAKAAFVLSSILNGMGVKISDYTSMFGNNAEAVISQLGLTDNYYAFDLDLSSLIGNTFSKVYAAVVRNNDGGLKGVKAYAVINDGDNEVVKLTVNLDGGLITAENENNRHAADYYKAVTAANPGIKFGYDDGTKKFGCYSTEDSSYNYSEYNRQYVLNVYDFGGADYADCPLNTPATVLNEKHANVKLRSGSTVYMLEEDTWLDEDKTLKLIYVDEDGNDLGLSFRIKADTNIYMMIVGESKVHFYDKDKNACNVVGSEDNSLVLYAGDTLPDPQSLTVDIDGVNYTFAGWYTEGYERLITSVQSGIDEYFAKYVLTEVTKENGVAYKFIRSAEDAEGGHYVVSGFNASHSDGVDYSDANNTLVLANVLDGFKVTEIAANALAAANLKNIIIPENVKAVGANAFRNNHGLRNVVFLAPRVCFYGNSGYNKNADSITTPFYGCNNDSAGQTTALKLYYNYIYTEGNNYSGKDGNPEWALFNWYASNKPRFIGNDGGERISENWSYVMYEVSGDYSAEQLGLKDYVTTSAVYDGKTADEILAAVNADTLSKYGYVYGYQVELNGAYSLSGITVLSVQITKAFEHYAFEFNANTEICEAYYQIAEEDKKVYPANGKLYVKDGAEVTLSATAQGSYEFAGWIVNGETVTGNPYTFNTGAEVKTTAVTANWSAAYADSVYVSSELGFNYGGTEYSGGSRVKIENAAVGEVLETPKAEGYDFLGWATADGEELTVLSGEQLRITDGAEATYRALWAVKKDGIEFAVSSNAEVTVKTNATEGEVFGWYAGSGFNGTVTESESFSLSASVTVVTLRLKYKLTVKLNADNTTWRYTAKYDSADVDDSMSAKYSWGSLNISGGNDIAGNQENDLGMILEGYTVCVYRFYSDGLTIRVTEGNRSVVTYLIKGFYVSGTISKSAAIRKLAYDLTHYFEFGSGWTLSETSGLKSDTAGQYYKTYTTGEDDLLFASVANASGNVSFSLKA